ncbi:hypothetical protein [Pseudarthrobacter albicanus]|uniref:hypothetical protein n=1 Tax=Pseudarthrobacter albicanus TaxID=2823873 RepID=UPI0027DD1560|nr:hypothetical protein [Pseudarthrobacter albicanus]
MVGDDQQVAAGGGLIGEQLGQSRNHGCQTVVGAQRTGFRNLMQMHRTVLLGIDAQSEGASPRLKQRR